jgi:septum formation protein
LDREISRVCSEVHANLHVDLAVFRGTVFNGGRPTASCLKRNATERVDMQFQQLRSIHLASASPRRIDYLQRYGLVFSARAGFVDETALPGERPVDFAGRMACEKASAVADQCDPDTIILAADTIVVLDKTIMGKPGSAGEALTMLRRLNGRTHQVITAYAILDRREVRQQLQSTSTWVTFRRLEERWLQSYAATPEPLDKAGAYSIQGLGTLLVQSIDGSYNNVVGLPVEQLMPDLLALGVITLAGT